MDTTTSMLTIVVGACAVLFSIAVFAAALYGILVWYPRKRQARVDDLKSKGKQGEATIIRLPGLETYQVDKLFTFPTHALGLLDVGKVVAVWVNPKEPRNLDKIVIHAE